MTLVLLDVEQPTFYLINIFKCIFRFRYICVENYDNIDELFYIGFWYMYQEDLGYLYKYGCWHNLR